MPRIRSKSDILESELRSAQESIDCIRHSLLFCDLTETEEDLFLSMLQKAIENRVRVGKQLEDYHCETMNISELTDLLC